MDKEFRFICCDANPQQLKNLSNKNINDVKAIEILNKIAHPLRLKILRVLIYNPDFCTCDFEKFFNETQPKLSRQLGILANAGILECRTLTMKGISGRWHVYRIKSDIKPLIAHIIHPFTKDSSII